MRLSQLLHEARPAIERAFGATGPLEGQPPTLFFSVCNGLERAHVVTARGPSLDQAWAQGTAALERWLQRQQHAPRWLRVDGVVSVQATTWAGLRQQLEATKRNYFARGIAFDAGFRRAVLANELGANALLYDNSRTECAPHGGNLRNYGLRRFGEALQWPTDDNAPIWTFDTRAVFTDGHDTLELEHQGRHAGYRQVPDWGAGRVADVARRASDYLSRQVKAGGEYHYGWFPCFDRPIPTYNTLRHASSTYALLEGWELTRDPAHKAAIDRALEHLAQRLIHTCQLPGGDEAAFLVDTGDEIKLGGNAVSLLAFAKHAELTGERRGVAFDEAVRARAPSADHPRALRLLLGRQLPVRSVTPAHEWFHVFQYGATMFKHPWWLEGQARWSEHVFTGRPPSQAALPHDAASLQQWMASSYEAAPAWARLLQLLDPVGSAWNTALRDRHRYGDGSPILRTPQVHGIGFLKNLFEALGTADQALADARGWDRNAWSETDQRDPRHHALMWQVIRQVARAHLPPGPQSPELAGFLAIELPLAQPS